MKYENESEIMKMKNENENESEDECENDGESESEDVKCCNVDVYIMGLTNYFIYNNNKKHSNKPLLWFIRLAGEK